MEPSKEIKYRPLTFMEMQKYLVLYGAAISVFSPAASAYQLSKIYSTKLTTSQILKQSLFIFPHQTLLKLTQMNISTPVKEHINPLIAFGVIGVLQGGVYGQANIHFSKAFQLGSKSPSLKGMFRGSIFAAIRDSISQGLPFLASSAVREKIVEPVLGQNQAIVSKWISVLSTSIFATYLSQGLHNCQIKMQSDQTLTYASTLKSVVQQHGVSVLYKGAEARVGLLLIVNLLNEMLLKPAWNGVPVDQE